MVDERIEKYAYYGIIALVNHIKENKHSDSMTMTYGEFARKINNLDKGNNADYFRDIGKVLEHIWTLWSDFHKNNHDDSKPFITILFVGDKREFPSKGYGKLDTEFNALLPEKKREKMKEQIELIKECLQTEKLDKFLSETVSEDYRNAVPKQEDDNSKIMEGATLRTHREVEYRSRDYSIVKNKKEQEGYKCQCCGFNFHEAYGELGKEYIECHHIKPLADFRKGGEKIKPENDLAVLCANCHRMIHRLLIRDKEKYKGNYHPSIDDLRSLIEEHKAKT